MRFDLFNNEINKIKNSKMVYIYGAGDVSREVYYCLSSETYGISVSAFLVSSISSTTPKEIENIPVMKYNDERIDKSAVVIIAVLEKYRDEICEKLDSVGMTNRIFMTFESDLWSVTRGKLFEQYCVEKQYPYLFNLDTSTIGNSNVDDSKNKVYVTRSTKDKTLNKDFKKREWEEEVLAGAALEHVGTECVRDDEGVNISTKNRKYCELTVMYWLWKNRKHDYVGLSHYRRRFDFTEAEINKIYSDGIDVVVTTPIINVPNVCYMYGKNHDKEDWNIMKEVVDKTCSEYISSIETVEKSNYYIPYNMFIMKWNVFVNYCEWLFPILEKCEQLIGDKDDTYQNRYIGFLAERLMTAYIYHNRSELRVLFCNKHFLE